MDWGFGGYFSSVYIRVFFIKTIEDAARAVNMELFPFVIIYENSGNVFYSSALLKLYFLLQIP